MGVFVCPMGNNQNTAETREQDDTGYSNHCIACLEPIRPGARICPHCGSNQAGNKWRILGNTLKWIGGITAIISLIAASVQINELFIGWREKRVVIEELVMAAQLQLETSDYSNAWEFLDQALLLEPTSRIARQEQINLAMVWVKKINIHDKNFIDTIDKLMPVLYRGAASEDQHNAAMISAHLGWADMMRTLKGIKVKDIERHFKRSLSLDPENLYGNVMYGYWLLRYKKPRKYSTERVEQAAKHFQTALELGKSQEYVRSLQMSAYLYSGNLEAKIKAYETAILMLNKDETFSQSDRINIKNDLIQIIRRKDENKPNTNYVINYVKLYDTLVEILGPDQLLSVLHWAYPSKEEPDETGWWYVRGRLAEEIGDEKAAIDLYRELISRWPGSVYKDSNNARERIRQIELKMNICYVPMLVVENVTGNTQPAVKALQRKDILLSYNGVYIDNMDELKKAKEAVDTDNEVKVVFIRDATPLIFKIKAGKLGIRFNQMQVSERALGEYANIMCGREQAP